MSVFTTPTASDTRLRLVLVGPSGSGKTYTALKVAQTLGKRIALIDTERGSAAKYRRLFNFQHAQLKTFSPLKYVAMIQSAERENFDVLIIDSLTHAWAGTDGVLEQVDKVARQSPSGNKYHAWAKVNPQEKKMLDTIMGTTCHVIATMRTRTAYAQDEVKGKLIPRKIGMEPIQRDGIEYEFDIVGELDIDNNLQITNTRCSELKGYFQHEPGEELAHILLRWLTDDDAAVSTVFGEPDEAVEEPAQDEQSPPDTGEEPVFMCEQCGNPIKDGVKTDGTPATVSELIDFSVGRYEQTLCLECIQAKKGAKEEAS